MQPDYLDALKKAEQIKSIYTDRLEKLENRHNAATELAEKSQFLPAYNRLPSLQEEIAATDDALTRYPYALAKKKYVEQYKPLKFSDIVKKKIDEKFNAIDGPTNAKPIASTVISSSKLAIEELAKQLSGLEKFSTDSVLILADYKILINKDIRSQQKKSLEGLKKAAFDAVPADATEANKQLQALDAETKLINQHNVNWKSNKVPKPTPGTKSVLSSSTSVEKAREKAASFIKNGGITLEDIAKLVPSGSQITFTPTGDYPDGFKYKWDVNGIEYEVYGHGKSPVEKSKDSAKGNVVRVKINKKYLQADGTLSTDAFTDEGHLSIF